MDIVRFFFHSLSIAQTMDMVEWKLASKRTQYKCFLSLPLTFSLKIKKDWDRKGEKETKEERKIQPPWKGSERMNEWHTHHKTFNSSKKYGSINHSRQNYGRQLQFLLSFLTREKKCQKVKLSFFASCFFSNGQFLCNVMTIWILMLPSKRCWNFVRHLWIDMELKDKCRCKKKTEMLPQIRCRCLCYLIVIIWFQHFESPEILLSSHTLTF